MQYHMEAPAKLPTFVKGCHVIFPLKGDAVWTGGNADPTGQHHLSLSGKICRQISLLLTKNNFNVMWTAVLPVSHLVVAA
jgi:hypothetical protein